MFKRKTVFIVGAGGSRELNFPMGEELKGQIAKKVNISYRSNERQSGDAKLDSAMFKLAEMRGSRDPNPWMAAGRQIASAMPQSISIDNFLHAHADDEYIIDVGKLGIVAAILDAERRSPIYNSQDSIELAKVGQTWHRTFFKMAFEGVQRMDPLKVFENVSFITFNYDRCIEHYAVEALTAYFLLSKTEAQELARTLQVIHPYGQVGHLPWQRANPAGGISFGFDVPAHSLPMVASQIRTFTERVDEETILKQMHNLLRQAEQIVCLGFSYGAMNLELLTIPPSNDFRHPSILGSSLGVSAPNSRNVEYKLQGVFRAQQPATLAPLTCDQLLQDYSLSLT